MQELDLPGMVVSGVLPGLDVVCPYEDGSCADEDLDELLKAFPAELELEKLYARCLEGELNFAEAAKKYATIVKREPRDVESHVRLATLLRVRLNKAADADKVSAELEKTTHAQTDEAAWLSLGRTLRLAWKQYDLDRAKD